MSLYLVFATRDLRAAVTATCTSFYMPLSRIAVVSYEGSADDLARRLDLDRTGGPGALVAAALKRYLSPVGTSFVATLRSLRVLT